MDPENPNRRWFHFTSLAATLPSFASVALNGEPTGDNVFSELGDQTGGWIDLTNGQFEVNVYAKYFNAVFCAAPAIVQGRFEGTFDRANWRATVQYDLGSISMISDSPSDSPAF